ncbi:hypothetical protein Dimus_012127 [Dionaea muscipula]
MSEYVGADLFRCCVVIEGDHRRMFIERMALGRESLVGEIGGGVRGWGFVLTSSGFDPSCLLFSCFLVPCLALQGLGIEVFLVIFDLCHSWVFVPLRVDMVTVLFMRCGSCYQCHEALLINLPVFTLLACCS